MTDKPFTIEVPVHDLSELLVWSARYTFGRQTYAPASVCLLLRRYRDALAPNDRALLVRELREAAARKGPDDIADDYRETADALEAGV